MLHVLVSKRVAHAFGLKAHAMPLGSALQFMRVISEEKNQDLVGLGARAESDLSYSAKQNSMWHWFKVAPLAIDSSVWFMIFARRSASCDGA